MNTECRVPETKRVRKVMKIGYMAVLAALSCINVFTFCILRKHREHDNICFFDKDAQHRNGECSASNGLQRQRSDAQHPKEACSVSQEGFNITEKWDVSRGFERFNVSYYFPTPGCRSPHQ